MSGKQQTAGATHPTSKQGTNIYRINKCGLSQYKVDFEYNEFCVGEDIWRGLTIWFL